MKFKFSSLKLRKKSSKQPVVENDGANPLVTPTDEEVQFGFKPAVNNSTGEKSPAVFDEVKTRNAKRDDVTRGSRSPEKRSEKHARHSAPTPTSPASRRSPRTKHARRPPSSTTSSASSSTNRTGHDQPKHFKFPPRQQVNGNLDSIDEEYYRRSTNNVNNRQRVQSNPGLSRHNSMMQLENWVQYQRMKQQIRKSDSSRYGSTAPYENGCIRSKRAPSSGKKWQPSLDSDYMDRNDPPSSILSVPIIRHQTTTSLPRPRSTQELHHEEPTSRRMVNSKSVGYLSPDYERDTLRMKSEHIVGRNRLNVPGGTSTSTQSLRRRRDDVGKMPGRVTSPPARTPSYFEAVTSGNPGLRHEDIQQMQHNFKQNHPSSGWRAREETRTEDDPDLQDKMRRVDLLTSSFERLVKDLNKMEEQSRDSTRGSSIRDWQSNGHTKMNRLLEKMNSIQNDCGLLQDEMNCLKRERLKELNRRYESKTKRHQLEWGMGRIQIALEKLNQINIETAKKMKTLNDLKANRENVSVQPRQDRSWSFNSSPNDLKSPFSERGSVTSQKRSPSTPLSTRSPNTPTSYRSSQQTKFSTLPGRGVYRSTSSSSLTNGSLSRFVRPSSTPASSNLQRSKSAAERLFSSSQGNLAVGTDPEEIKKIQREISRNRRRNLSTGVARKSSNQYSVLNGHAPVVGMDMKMAMKNYHMPKVLQRSKLQRAEQDRASKRDQERKSDPGCDVPFDEVIANHQPKVMNKKLAEKLNVDDSLVELIEIENNNVPRARLTKSTTDMTVEEQENLEKKIQAIERIMPSGGPSAFQPTSARLAAALAVEATSASKALSRQSQPNDNSCFV